MSELDVLYDSLKNRITIERDTFKQIFSTWNVTGLYEQDVLIGCVVQKNHEVHIGYKQKPTVSIRKHLKKIQSFLYYSNKNEFIGKETGMY